MPKDLLDRIHEKGIRLMDEADFPVIYTELMHNLGAVDSECRETCLDLLWEMIDSGELQHALLLDTGQQLVDNLKQGLGEQGTDSVFLRTFSALLIGAILVHDEMRRRQVKVGLEPFLTPEIFRTWYQACSHYLVTEADLRGYIPGKGWAHAISHGADLLRDFAYHSYAAAAEHAEMLAILNENLSRNDQEVFLNNDDNRLTRVVMTLLIRNELTIEQYQQWLDDLLARFNSPPARERMAKREQVTAAFNILTFLRALYFVLRFGMRTLADAGFYQQPPPLRDELMALVLSTLQRMDQGMNYRT